jgi:hypothetical protein
MTLDDVIKESGRIIQERVTEFFDLLEQENLLIKNDEIVSTNFIQRYLRVFAMYDSIDKKNKMYYNEEQFQKYLEINKEFGLTEKSFLFDLRTNKVHYFLALQELASVFLTNILDSAKLNMKMNKIMLGETISKLGAYKNSDGKSVFLKDVLGDIFHIHIRNSIGHDEWWVDSDGTFYFKDETPISELGFDAEIITFHLFVGKMAKEYTHRKFPEFKNMDL